MQRGDTCTHVAKYKRINMLLACLLCSLFHKQILRRVFCVYLHSWQRICWQERGREGGGEGNCYCFDWSGNAPSELLLLEDHKVENSLHLTHNSCYFKYSRDGLNSALLCSGTAAYLLEVLIKPKSRVAPTHPGTRGTLCGHPSSTHRQHRHKAQGICK